MEEKKECCTTRDVLWYLVFTGFAVNYMTRTNLNIALVSMVKSKTNPLSLASECTEYNMSSINWKSIPENKTMMQEDIMNITTVTSIQHSILTNRTNPSHLKEEKKSKVFEWNEKQQGTILGSFFWLHWVTQIPGGILAAKYGTKLVFGLSNFGAVIFIYLIPIMANMGSNYLIITRVVQGLVSGFAWPAMHHLTAQWIPPNERSKFITAYLGSSVGTAITYPLCGFIIERWGWELVFYVNGALGTLWFIAWWTLVYDSPLKHPRISDSERNHIVSSLGKSVSKRKQAVPWSKILTSPPVIFNIIAQLGGVWGLFTLMTTGPTYFKFIHGWNIRDTGIVAGMPHIVRLMFAYIVSQLGDYLLRTNKMTRTNVRKIATALCCILQGIFTLCLAYSGCDRNAAIIYFTLAVASHGAVSTGPLASIVDISPNYASILLGITNTIVTVTGFLTPTVVGYLTLNNQTVHQWQKVYWISTSFMVTAGIIYCLFAKAELQSWNSNESEDDEKDHEKELMVIKKGEDQLDNSQKLIYESDK